MTSAHHQTAHGEGDAHVAFAESRTTSFVYVQNNDLLFQTLDSHCETSELEAKLPLVILGDKGTGKSALIANWINQRREIREKNEFLFAYYVECSTESFQLTRMLRSLEESVKDAFNLREMEVPASEERLRWSLPRFIESAAKKYSSHRLIFVIDGVNRLKSEDAPEGSLKWLPTVFPVNVRFILSTVERVQEPPPGSGTTKKKEVLHRTYLELKRRGCPFLRMEPLTARTRNEVLAAFREKHGGSLQFSGENERLFLGVTATEQPLFLRLLLECLQLGVKLASKTVTEMLKELCAAEDTDQLVTMALGVWSSIVDRRRKEERGGLLGRVLSLTFVSRHGLSWEELWGAVSLGMKGEEAIDAQEKEAVMRILEDNTYSVKGLRSFSHEVIKEAVWRRYIQRPEACVQLHGLLAKYFTQLPPCDRKLAELPYHLRISGAWGELKDTLSKVELFELWWTPKHKDEFMKLWLSLVGLPSSSSSSTLPSALPPLSLSGSLSTTGLRKGNPSISKTDMLRNRLPPAGPTDLVELYSRSLEEFASQQTGPDKDETVANVVLKIADFLLEFGTSGLEVHADVPSFGHPEVTTEDLASIGVPYLSTDEEGRSLLCVPSHLCHLFGSSSLHSAEGAKESSYESSPSSCTTYFYKRWMWIHFPLVALANCGPRYFDGVKRKKEAQDQSLPLPGSAGNSSGAAGEKDGAGERQPRERQGQISHFRASSLTVRVCLSSAGSNGVARHGEEGQKTVAAVGKGVEQLKDKTATERAHKASEEMEALGDVSQAKTELLHPAKEKRDAVGTKRSGNREGSVGDISEKEAPKTVSCPSTATGPTELNGDGLPSPPSPRQQPKRQSIFQSTAKLDVIIDCTLKKKKEQLMASIQALRADLDATVQERVTLEQREEALQREKGLLAIISNTLSKQGKLFEALQAQEKDYLREQGELEQLTQNFRCLLSICHKHPAKSDAVISTLEAQLHADREVHENLLKRLRDCRYEIKGLAKDTSKLLATISDSEKMYANMLQALERQKKRFEQENIMTKERHLKRISDEKELAGDLGKEAERKLLARDAVALVKVVAKKQRASTAINQLDDWEEMWSKINQRTGVSNPDVFLEKCINRETMEQNLNELRATGEKRLHELKEKLRKVDLEFEELKYGAISVQSTSSSSKDVRDKDLNLADAQTRLRRACQKAESAELLLQSVLAGIKHIVDKIGLAVDPDCGAVELLEQVDKYVAALAEEREKRKVAAQAEGDLFPRNSIQMPKTGPTATENGKDMASQVTNVFRTRLPQKLVTRFTEDLDEDVRVPDNEECEALPSSPSSSEAVMDRQYIKDKAKHTVKAQLKGSALPSHP